MINLEKAKQEFQKYVETFDLTDKDIKLKLEHSYEVTEISEKIARQKKLSEEEIKLATLIGLLHDIGRFYQIEQTHGYDDKKLDHAEYGVKYLFEENHIRDFVKETKYDEIIKKAVLHHNDYSLPDNLTDDEELYCKIIRDADKIDIFRVHTEYFKFYFNKEDVNKKVKSDFLSKKSINKEDRKSKSDDTYVILAFLNDINFKESYKIIEEKNYFQKFINNVEVDKESKEEWETLTNICNTIIERRDKNVR